MLEPMKKAYFYTRMSSLEQKTGDSKRRQSEAATNYAIRKKLVIVERYDDILSAYMGKNVEFGALSAFIEAVKDKKIERGSVLIVESIDRLSRQTVDKALSLFLQLIGYGIKLVTLSPEEEYSEKSLANPYQLVGALFVMARAHEESKMKGTRLQAAWVAKRRKARAEGKVTTKRVPGWLQVEGGKVVVVEDRAEVVREIFIRSRDGWGAYSIAKTLNQRNVVPWGKPKGEAKTSVWRESYIKKILSSRTVLGEYQPHTVQVVDSKQVRTPDGDPLVGYYPAVISVELYQETAAALSARSLVGRGRKGGRYANLFTGLLRCRCGAGYRFIDKGEKPKGGQYLQCSVALVKGACAAPLLRLKLVEDVLFDALKTLDVRRVLDGPALDAKLVALRTARAGAFERERVLRKQIENLVLALRDGASSALATELRKLEADLAGVKESLEQIQIDYDDLSLLDPVRQSAEITRLREEIATDVLTEAVLNKRRALAAELQRLVAKIKVSPTAHPAWEIVEEYDDWMRLFGVKSIKGLERLIKEKSFEVMITYRTGATEHIDALLGPQFKTGKTNVKMKTMQLIQD